MEILPVDALCLLRTWAGVYTKQGGLEEAGSRRKFVL
jgi:hypothetical protein